MRWSQRQGVGVIAFENATFSRVPVTTTAAFDGLLRSLPVSKVLELWPETRAARDAVTALLRDWHDDAARALFSENVEWDMPFPQRQAALAAAIAKVGGLSAGDLVDVS